MYATTQFLSSTDMRQLCHYHITHVCPIALLLQTTYRAHITAYVSKKQQTAKFVFHAITIYVSEKYAPQMPDAQITHYAFWGAFWGAV